MNKLHLLLYFIIIIYIIIYTIYIIIILLYLLLLYSVSGMGKLNFFTYSDNVASF